MNHFGKWKTFSFPLDPFQPSPSLSLSFFSFPAGQKPPPPARFPFLQAQLGPARPSPSLSHRQAGPARRDRLPSPSEPDSWSNPTEISAPPCSLRPHAKAALRPYISAPRPPGNPKPKAAAAAFVNPSSHPQQARARKPPPPSHRSTAAPRRHHRPEASPWGEETRRPQLFHSFSSVSREIARRSEFR